ncbi:hypothetical protein CF319_g1376 [Tilletia indica]|nr:hypothetical protein CF319_g1376 [Tilletia indica]
MFNRSTSFSFGQNASTTAQAPTAPQTNTMAGSLFGAQPQQQQQPASTFSFGASQPQQQPATTSLFGQPAQQQQQQQQPQKQGLFGASLGGGLFGSSTNTAQQQQQQPAQSTFSFGQPQQQQQQQQPQLQWQQQSQQQQQPQQQQAGASPFSQYPFHQRERFNDLPDAPKKLLEELDEFIQSQHRIRAEVRTKDYGTEQIKKSSSLVTDIRHELNALNTLILPSDLSQARELASTLDADHRDLKHMCDIVSLIHHASNPQQQAAQAQQAQSQTGSGGPGAGGRLIGPKEIAELGLGGFGAKYFANVANSFKERIERYRATMESIERFLNSMDGSNSQNPEAIANALKAQHAEFMSLASQVTALHAEIELLRTDFTRWYQRTNNCIRDPFAGIVASAGGM